MLQNYNLLQVASVFFKSPQKPFGLLEISKEINLAHTSVKKYLEQLKDLQLITFQSAEFGNRKAPVFKANYTNPKFIFYKKLYNLHILEESGIIDYLEKEYQPNSIVLFGSYAKGEDDITSDIDIFLECEKKDISLKDFRIHRKIELHFKDNFKSYPDELKNNILNGVVLRGFLEGNGKDTNNS